VEPVADREVGVTGAGALSAKESGRLLGPRKEAGRCCQESVPDRASPTAEPGEAFEGLPGRSLSVSGSSDLGPRRSGDRSLRVIRSGTSLSLLEIVPVESKGRGDALKLSGELGLCSGLGSGLGAALAARSDCGVLTGDCFSGERDLARSTINQNG